MRETTGYAAMDPAGTLRRWGFERRDPREDDVVVRVLYCGVCHSDLDAVEHGDAAVFPLVPGHEFVGEVIETGSSATRFTAGDVVAVGNIVDSCGECEPCHQGQQNYCDAFPTLTYAGTDRRDGTQTQGGYAREYLVSERFTYRVPDGLNLAGVAPLMCAGVTTWEPLRRWEIGPGRTVGVVGLGGLGHLALKFAHALGATTALFTTSPDKASDARGLGADEVIVSSDVDQMARHANQFDLILDTASAAHDLSPYLRAVAMDGTLCSLGLTGSLEFDPLSLLIGRKSLASAGSGGTAGTRDMLAFCGEHGITADVETLPATEVNTAIRRLRHNDVRYRFTLDMTEL